MSRKVKYSIEEKLNAVQKYLDGKESMYSIANRFGIDVSAVRLWVNKYRAMGVDAFSTNQNKHYTKEEKEQAVAAYLHGEGSLMSICKKFKKMCIRDSIYSVLTASAGQQPFLYRISSMTFPVTG